MTEPINLNKFRKAKKRAEKEQRAFENRIKHGRTKAEKLRDKSQIDKLKKSTDGHKLDDSGTNAPDT